MTLKMREVESRITVDPQKILKDAASWIVIQVVHNTNMWDQVWPLLNEEDYEVPQMSGILGII